MSAIQVIAIACIGLWIFFSVHFYKSNRYGLGFDVSLILASACFGILGAAGAALVIFLGFFLGSAALGLVN